MSQTETAVPDGGDPWVWRATIAFGAAMAVKVWRHEPYRDELQAWSIARASHSVGQLFENARYEGHPPLWHLLLWPLARISADPVAMQVLSVLLATGTAFLILRSAPFSRRVKIALVLSYFPFYEYSVIARNYGLGMLLAVGGTLLVARGDRSWRFPVVMALLALTSAYGLILAGALTLGWVLQVVGSTRRAEAVRAGVLALPVVAAGMALSLRLTIPPPDSPYGLSNPPSSRGTIDALANAWKGLVPVPMRLNERFWENNILERVPSGGRIQIVLGTLLLVAVVVVVRRSPVAVATFLSGMFVLDAFSLIQVTGRVRHAGTIALLVLAALWLARTSDVRWHRTIRAGPSLQRLMLPVERAAGLALVLALAGSIVASAVATVRDGISTFSPARDVAAAIETAGLADAYIIGHHDTTVSGVAAYLDRPIWYFSAKEPGTFVRFVSTRQEYRPGFALAAQRIAREHSDPVVVVSDEPLPDLDARLLLRTPASTTESMWVYVAD